MIILGIETSCDETAISLVDIQEKGDFKTCKILANIIHSQIPIHKEYGGVFPMMAKREHAKNLIPILESILNNANLEKKDFKLNQEKIAEIREAYGSRDPDFLENILNSKIFNQLPKIDRIAVTQGPGLAPALWIGLNFAKVLSRGFNIPLSPTNHMEGHVLSVLVDSQKSGEIEFKKIKWPAIALLISGGHTEIVFSKEIGKYERIGKTKDDAIGEAYDKVGRLLGLNYPAGREVGKLAEEAREKNIAWGLKLPRPMIDSKDLDFSFSGLKTAVLYSLKNKTQLIHEDKCGLAREFEEAVKDVIIKKTERAIELMNPNSLIVGGGVIANKYIKDNLEELARRNNIEIFTPSEGLTGDNALMIAISAYFKDKTISPEDVSKLEASGNWTIDRL